MVQKQRGFTIVEMLVVIAIIGILVGLLLPAVAAARESARRAECLNNLSQIAKSANIFHTNNGYLPSSRHWAKSQVNQGGGYLPQNFNSIQRLTWVHQLLPLMDKNDVYETLLRSSGTETDVTTFIKSLVCPSDVEQSYQAPLSYAINGGRVNTPETANGGNHDWSYNGAADDQLRIRVEDGMYRRNRMTLSDIRDGASNTIWFAENIDLTYWNAGVTEYHAAIVWHVTSDSSSETVPATPSGFGINKQVGQFSFVNEGNSVDYNSSAPPTPNYASGWNVARPSSRHPGGVNISFCDGSARFVSETLDYSVYCRLMTSDGTRSRPPGTAESDATYPRAPDWQVKPVSANEIQ